MLVRIEYVLHLTYIEFLNLNTTMNQLLIFPFKCFLAKSLKLYMSSFICWHVAYTRLSNAVDFFLENTNYRYHCSSSLEDAPSSSARLHQLVAITVFVRCKNVPAAL